MTLRTLLLGATICGLLLGARQPVFGVGPADDPPTVTPMTDALLRGHRLVDLSHRFDDTTIYWPTSPSRF